MRQKLRNERIIRGLKIFHRRHEWKDGDVYIREELQKKRHDIIIRGIKKVTGGTCPPFLVTYKGHMMKIREFKVRHCVKLTKTAELV